MKEEARERAAKHIRHYGAKTDKELGITKESKEVNETATETIKKPGRKERVPFGGARLKLSVPAKEGKVRRWINDVGGRCQLAEGGGYEFVTDDGLKIGDTNIGSGNQSLGSRVSRIVGTQADGKAMTAFLMEIDEELYKEDQEEKQKKIDLIDEQIQRGNIEGQVGRDGRYVPKEGISYKP